MYVHKLSVTDYNHTSLRMCISLCESLVIFIKLYNDMYMIFIQLMQVHTVNTLYIMFVSELWGWCEK